MDKSDKSFAKELIRHFFYTNKDEMLEMIQEDLVNFINNTCSLYLNKIDKKKVEIIAEKGCLYIDDKVEDCDSCPLRIFNNEKMPCKDIAKNLLLMTGGVENN